MSFRILGFHVIWEILEQQSTPVLWNSLHKIKGTALLIRIPTFCPRIFLEVLFMRGHAVAQVVEALRCKPIPDAVAIIIHWHNLSGRRMALGLAQHLTETSTRGSSYLRLTTLSTSCADCLGIWEPEPPGNRRAFSGLYIDCLTFYSS